MSESDMKYSKFLKYLNRIAPCLLTTILTSIYAFGIWNGLNLTVVNEVTLFLFFLQLSQGFVKCENKKKELLFLSAVFISTAVGGLNLWTDYQILEAFHLSGLSMWSLAWVILFLIAIISALIILRRLLQWSQEQWEEVKKMRQEHRKNKKKLLLEYLAEKYLNQLNIKLLQQIHEQQIQEIKQQRQTIKRESKYDSQEIKQQRRIEQWEFNLQRNRSKREDKLTGKNSYSIKFKLAGRWILFGVFLIGFVLFPCADSVKNGFSDWINAVKTFAESLRGGHFKSGQQALFYYILFYIVAAAVIFVIGYLIVHIINHDSQQKSNKGFAFFEAYQFPIAILIVFGSFFYVLTDGKLDLSGINQWWQVLFLIILLILVLFTAIEIVQIVVAQCAEANSLLKKIISLIFVVILKFVSELILGIITNFHIQMVISSLFALIFPESEESENSFNVRLNNKINHLFNKAILEVEDENSKAHTLKAFHRQHIWRRHKNGK